MPHQLIHSVSLSQSQVIEVNGGEIISIYVQLCSIIDERWPDSLVVLAEPVKNLQHDRINWFSNVDGQFRPLNSLSLDDQAQAQAQIDEFIAKIRDLSQELLRSALIKDKKNGDLLAKLLPAPSPCLYYWSPKKIVVVGWGLKSLVSLPIIQEESGAKKFKPGKKEAGLNLGPVSSTPSTYERWQFKKFLKKVALGALLGLAVGLLAIYFKEPKILEALKTLINAPNINMETFEANEKNISDLRKSLEEYKLGFKDKRSVCLIFSEDDVSSENFAYLQGCWTASARKYLNAFTGQEAYLGFCYKKASNEAEFVINSKGEAQDCRAPAQVAYKDGKLLLTAKSTTVCAGESGDSFPQYSLECSYSPQGSQAACSLVQFDKVNSVFPVEFFKKSGNAIPRK
ncbi:MAG: hypothetical protein LBT38_06200 [Deltaproteobacteria bacterium]|jgi:hypothetical protein|nr:hypothetical protein [Deltaproteobacteria bacterium]